METDAKITKSYRKEDVVRDWYIVDASNHTLGRLATQVAILLRGKHKPWFTPHVDTGDFVIVVNADKIIVKGKREQKKYYFHHTGYPEGERIILYKEVYKNNPEFIITHAVKGMLPKNRLGRQIIKKLKVYRGSEHPHSAQKPIIYQLSY